MRKMNFDEQKIAKTDFDGQNATPKNTISWNEHFSKTDFEWTKCNCQIRIQF